KADEFILEPALGDPGSGLARFLERRRWSGVVQVQLKNNSRVLYFECVLNAIVNDDQSSALAPSPATSPKNVKRRGASPNSLKLCRKACISARQRATCSKPTLRSFRCLATAARTS